MNLSYQPHKHIPALDSLRGIAVLLVIIFHCFPHNVTKIGWIGVDIFFVLSGFLITGILLDTKGKKNFYLNFIVRRTLRIFPLYYFSLILCLVLIPVFLPGVMSPGFSYYIIHQPWFWLYCQNWLFSLTGFPEDHTLVHFWSLAVEEQFYVFWPFVIMLVNRKWLLPLSLMLIVFSSFFKFYLGQRLGLVSPFEYMATVSRMDALLIGAIIAILIRDKKQWLEKYTKYFAVVSFVIVLAGLAKYRSLHFINLAPLYIFIEILAGCFLLYMLAAKPSTKSIFDNSVFAFLGKYSYGLYVYHYIIFNILKHHYWDVLKTHVSNAVLAMVVLGLIALLLSLVISLLSFKILESPLLKLKKYF